MKRNIVVNESAPVDKNTAALARNILIVVIGSMLIISSGLLDVIF